MPIQFFEIFNFVDFISVFIFEPAKKRFLTGVLAQSAYQAMFEGPWRHLLLCPTREQMDYLRGKYALRGADFWHLALARTLKKDIPELIVLTFDHKLREGAEREGFGFTP